jgi:integrase
MGRKRDAGLKLRNGIWHIDKWISGRRICRSCKTSDLKEAEATLARIREETRQAGFFGVRPKRTFEQAAAKFVVDYAHKRSIDDDISRLSQLLPFIGQLALDRVHRGALDPFVERRRKEGAAAGTINHGLKVVRRIVNLAAKEWVDEHGLSWIANAPVIKLLPDREKRKPYPLSWDEQARLFEQLPDHLVEMALFAVNTGCRDGEVCRLRWDWEVQVRALGRSVFINPSEIVKNGDERLVVLNRTAQSVIDAQRGKHPENVFVFNGKPVTRMLNSAWMKARARAGLPQVRVHDLKHTFGRRLRAAGVSFEDRQDLLGHRSGRITTHYSAAELSRLIEAADSVCERQGSKPELVVLRRLSVS